jgi:hypothetical protein
MSSKSTDPNGRRDPAAPADDVDVEIVDGTEVVEHPDPITRREGMEQELLEEGRSEDGADIGEHID